MIHEITQGRLLNVFQASKYLGVGYQTLYQRRPDIPRIRIGRRVLFDVKDLDEFIATHRFISKDSQEVRS